MSSIRPFTTWIKLSVLSKLPRIWSTNSFILAMQVIMDRMLGKLENHSFLMSWRIFRRLSDRQRSLQSAKSWEFGLITWKSGTVRRLSYAKNWKLKFRVSTVNTTGGISLCSWKNSSLSRIRKPVGWINCILATFRTPNDKQLNRKCLPILSNNCCRHTCT